VANRWLDSIKHTLAPGTIQQKEIHIKNVAPYFKGMPVRNVTPFHGERWPRRQPAQEQGRGRLD
jgi:hypothetical protein